MKPIIFKNESDKESTIFAFGVGLVVILLWMSAFVYTVWGGNEEFFAYRFAMATTVEIGILSILGVFMIITTIIVFIYAHFTNEPISRSDKTMLVICSIVGVFAIICALIFYDTAQNEYAKIQSRQVKTEQITETVFDDKYGIVIDGIEFDATEAAYLIDKDYIDIDNYEITVDDTSKQVIFSESN